MTFDRERRAQESKGDGSANPAPPTLWSVALDAATWLKDGDAGRLRRCDHEGCIRFFYDQTRNRSRRWCSMATCGHREKSRMFRQRRSQAREPTDVAAGDGCPRPSPGHGSATL